MIPIPLRVRLLSAVWAVCAALSLAQGQTSPCPVDGVRLALPTAHVWNDAGGLDSDGCRWSLDAEGGWRIAGLNAVVACPQCHAAFRFDHLPLPLTQAESDRVRAALARTPHRVDDPAGRFQLAVITYEALGSDRVRALGLGLDAFLGELLLHAAWAERGGAVLPQFDAAYRPRDLPRARRTLIALEEGTLRQRRRGPGVGELLLEAERLRLLARQVDQLPDPVASVLSDRLVEHLIRLEQSLYALRDALPAERAAAGSDADAHLGLVRAWLRYGDPERRAAWERSARTRFGEVVEGPLRAIAAAAEREAALLDAAGARFATAAEAPDLTPPRRARLHFLAGDCARRRGDAERAALHLQRARELAPGSRSSQDAAFLLGQR